VTVLIELLKAFAHIGALWVCLAIGGVIGLWWLYQAKRSRVDK